MSLIVERFIEICAEYKDKPAFVFAKKGELVEKSFCELERDVCAAVGYLSDFAIGFLAIVIAFHIKSRGGKSKVIVYRSCVGMSGNDNGKVTP